MISADSYKDIGMGVEFLSYTSKLQAMSLMFPNLNEASFLKLASKDKQVDLDWTFLTEYIQDVIKGSDDLRQRYYFIGYSDLNNLSGLFLEMKPIQISKYRRDKFIKITTYYKSLNLL